MMTSQALVAPAPPVWPSQLHNAKSMSTCPYGPELKPGVFENRPYRRCLCTHTTCTWVEPEGTEICNYKSFPESQKQDLSDLLQVMLVNSKFNSNSILGSQTQRLTAAFITVRQLRSYISLRPILVLVECSLGIL